MEERRYIKRRFVAGQSKKVIVSTQFVEWATTQFSRGEAAGAEGAFGSAAEWAGEAGDDTADCESRAHHERVWRRARNRSIRREARSESRQMHHGHCSLTQAAWAVY